MQDNNIYYQYIKTNFNTVSLKKKSNSTCLFWNKKNNVINKNAKANNINFTPDKYICQSETKKVLKVFSYFEII